MSENYELYVKSNFSAAHALAGYDGDCARLHGHNWMIEVYVRCKTLDEIGIGIDFREIKQSIKELLKDLDHCNLSELPVFQDINPTSEHLARHIYKELSRRLNSANVRVSKVKVSETPGAGAFYWED